VSLPSLNQPFVEGSVETSNGPVPRVSSSLTIADRFGTWKARWGVGRMHYAVEPGLYALGRPDKRSPVLATANYKMSFDKLRECLPHRNAWLLVLDTKGINVWCAAGKGTFCTDELAERIRSSGLANMVVHRRIILPQLSAPGVASHMLKGLAGFKAVYGPIRASDLPAFLDSGLRTTPEKRRKTFPLPERVALIPIELVAALKVMLYALPAFCLLSGLGGPSGYWTNVSEYGLFTVIALLGAVFAGTVAAPILLPWLPGRAFSWKGLLTGLIATAAILPFHRPPFSLPGGKLELVAWFFLVPAFSAYFAMNFTGASTYTSLSGVKKEMRVALPLQIGAGILGAVLWLASRLVS
jgi:hypothetical protein